MTQAANFPIQIQVRNTFGMLLKGFQVKKKISSIPPIFFNDAYITKFEHKADIFNKYFSDQCSVNDNGSILPEMHLKTSRSLSENEERIVEIIRSYSPAKAHGYDNIAVSMLQLCSAYPLRMIFQKCIETGSFPDCWKKANVQPIHKKNSRHLITNYRPISLLPIFEIFLKKLCLTSFTST